MRFVYMCLNSLPRLAWCARMVAGSDVAEIIHGPWVETWQEGFCEGAWDGPFEEGRFAEAVTFAGSGGCATNGGILFASSTNITSLIYTVRADNRLLVSNSLVFLLTQTGDALAVDYPYYYFAFVRHKRCGLTRPTAAVPTAERNRLYLHHYTNLFVRSDLSLCEQRKNLGTAPTDFAGYRDMLQSGVERVFLNAAHASRKQQYRPLATLSQGYDAPAVAALATRAGCTQAFAFRAPAVTQSEVEERGALLGRYLRLTVSEYDLFGFRALPDIPEAEFCAGMAFGAHVPLSMVAAQLEGTLLLTGHPGDDIWTTKKKLVLPQLLAPRDRIMEGTSHTEYRLRVGFFWFPAPWIGAYHKQAIYRITRSAEMRPWSVAGRYNRPIPRRIAEEAGVPRDLFGQTKMATFNCKLDRAENMTVRGWHDFEAFCETHVQGAWLRRGENLKRAAARADAVLFECLQRLPKRLYLACMPMALWSLRDRATHNWESKFLFTFHWGTERIRHRYAL